MAASVQAFGNKGYASSGSSDSIGIGTRQAGEWLTVVVSTYGANSAATPVVSDDISGSAGWELIKDHVGPSGDGSTNYHATYWKKLCVGSEGTVTVTPSGGSVDLAWNGAWISGLTQRDLYIIDQGEETYTPGVNNAWQSTVPPETDHETYIALTANGVQPLVSTGMSSPSNSGGAAQLLTGGANTVVLWNNSEGSNTVADLPLFFDSQDTVDLHNYVVWLGTRQTQIAQFTAGGSSVSLLSQSIGGTARAGDWLQVTLNAGGGAASSGATPSDDVSGSAGWEKVADHTAATTRQDWIKRAVGGETTVTVTWTGSVTDASMTGFWAFGLSQPDLYVIAQDTFSVATFSEQECPTGCVRTDKETYVASFSCNSSPIIKNLNGICSTASAGQLGAATAYQTYCNSESSNTKSQRPAYEYAFGDANGWVVYYGFWTDPGETFPAVSSSGEGTTSASANTQRVVIVGNAQPGDLLTLVATSDSVSVTPTITDESSDGGASWVLESSDATPGGGGLVCVFTKVAVGLEAVVTADWGTSVHSGMIVALWENPTQPDLYVVDEGRVSGGVFTSANPPSGAGQTYVAMAGIAISGATTSFFHLDDPPGDVQEGGSHPTGVAFNSNSGNTSFAYAMVSNAEAANGTGDVLQADGLTDDTWVVFFAIQGGSTPVIDLAGTGTLGLGGTGELFSPVTELEGDGTLGLGGTGDLTVLGPALLEGDGTLGLGAVALLTITGGELTLAGVAGLGLGGSATRAPVPPGPIPGPPDLSDVLDCGIYEAIVFTRGLGEIVGMLPFGEVDWARELDGVSTASLTVDGVANASQLQKCCRLLGSVEPYEHELALYRNGYRCWSGPITAMTFPPNQILISAADLSSWLSIRTLHADYNAVQVDLIDIWVNYVQDAMSVDNSPGLYPTVLAPSGILGDRLTQITEHNVALDAIGELERTGIDWTTVDRTMQAGPVLTQPPPIANAGAYPLLIDASFRTPPTILLDGAQGANCWFVQGAVAGAAGAVIFGEYGPAFDATPDHIAQDAAPDYAEIEAQYGRIERVTSESRALDQATIDDNAQSRYDLTKRPVSVISEGLLLPSAPIAMRKLVPGSLVQVHLANACKPIGDFYRIKSVKVTAHGDGSEDVNVEFQPLGTGTVLA